MNMAPVYNTNEHLQCTGSWNVSRAVGLLSPPAAGTVNVMTYVQPICRTI